MASQRVLMVLSVIPNTILHPVWFLLPLFTVQVLRADVDMGGYLLADHGGRRVHINGRPSPPSACHPAEAYLLLHNGGAQCVLNHGVCLFRG